MNKERQMGPYGKGFLSSFFIFSMQIFIFKIAQFCYSDFPLILLYSFIVLGLSVGGISATMLKSMQKHNFFLYACALSGFVIAPHYSSEKLLYYTCTFLVFVPLGNIIVSGLQTAIVNRFYFSDLLGGGFGLFFGIFSLLFMQIETSLAFFIFLAAGFSIFESQSIRFVKIVKVMSFALAACLLFVQIYTNKLNLMTWSKNISEPTVTEASDETNAFNVIKNNLGAVLFSRWSIIDRVDLIRKNDSGIVLYANNTSWSEVASPYSKDHFPYVNGSDSLKSFLSIGSGGGVDFITAKRLKAKKIVGLEINEAAVSLVKRVASEYNPGFLDNIDFRAEDARFFLKNNTEKFDLIVSKYTDTRNRSDRYFSWLNLLRTSDSIESILRNLADGGFGVWVFKFENGVLEPSLFSLLAGAYDYLGPSAGRDLKKHFIVVKEDQVWRKGGDSPVLHHIIFSKSVVSEEIVSRFFREHSGCQLIFPENIKLGQDQVVGLFSGLGSYSKKEELLKYLSREYRSTFALLSDLKPIEKNRKNSDYIFFNILMSIVGILLVTGSMILLNYRKSHNLTTYKRYGLQNTIYAASIFSGFSYGVLQASAIQEIEYYVSTTTVAYGIILSFFLLSGSLASFFSSKISFSKALYFYMLFPVAWIFWFYVDHSVVSFSYLLFIGILGFIYLFLISLLFPKLLESSRESSSADLSYVFTANMLSMALGAFCFYRLFLLYDRDQVARFVIWMTQACTIFVVALLKFFLMKKAEK